MTDIIERLKRGHQGSGVGPLDCHDALLEIERLRAAYLSHLQMENACKRTGSPCRDPEKCGCALELRDLLSQQEAK